MSDESVARSVLFADISGSMRLRDKLDDAEASRAVDRCLRRMERAVEAFGGRLVAMPGDELMAVFDLPDQAFRSASEMLQRIADLPPVSGVKLAIRIGLAHGLVNEDQGRVTGETVGAATHLAELAKPGQLLTSAQSLLSPALQQATRDLGSALTTDQFAGMNLSELVSPLAANPFAALNLRYDEQFVVLDDSKPSITIGRDAKNDLVIHDRRASRQQARIERREGHIVLVDSSSNGTYVTMDGQPELLVHGDECVIHGKGLICFAASASSPGADCAQFEQN